MTVTNFQCQRAGDYVLSWADELEKQYATIAVEKPASSTLVKRGAKNRAPEDDAESSKPAKKVKVEADNNIEEEVRRHYQKNNLSRVTIILPCGV